MALLASVLVVPWAAGAIWVQTAEPDSRDDRSMGLFEWTVDCTKNCYGHLDVTHMVEGEMEVLTIAIGWIGEESRPSLLFRISPRADPSGGILLKVMDFIDGEIQVNSTFYRLPLDTCDDDSCLAVAQESYAYEGDTRKSVDLLEPLSPHAIAAILYRDHERQVRTVMVSLQGFRKMLKELRAKQEGTIVADYKFV